MSAYLTATHAPAPEPTMPAPHSSSEEPRRRLGRPATNASLVGTLFAVALPLIVGACGGAGAAPAVAVAERIAVRTAPVGSSTEARPVTATGTLAAREEIPLGFPAGGVIARVLVREGDTVRRGQLLAALDLREVDARLAKARSAHAKADRDLARMRVLHADSVVALSQLQDATTMAEGARADLDAAEYARRYAAIVSPADGVVLRRQVEPGQVAAPGAPVLTIGNRASGMVLQVGVADRDVVRLRAGDAATVTFDAEPSRRYVGRVQEIAAASDARTGTYRVEIALDGAGHLPSGLVGRAEIAPRDGEASAVIPVEAVVEADGSRGVVYAVDVEHAPDGGEAMGRARRVEVEIGSVGASGVSIVSGLAGIDRIVTDGAAYLSPRVAVRIVP